MRKIVQPPVNPIIWLFAKIYVLFVKLKESNFRKFYLNLNRKIVFFITAFLLALIMALILDFLVPKFDGVGVLIEFHGMIFDILLFGILLTIYELSAEKKARIERYNEELDDYRGWKSEEASHRNMGLVRRLNKIKVRNIDLSNSYLCNIQLIDLRFFGAEMKGTDLSGSTIEHFLFNSLKFSENVFVDTIFKKGGLMECSFESVKWGGNSRIVNCNFVKCSFDLMSMNIFKHIDSDYPIVFLYCQFADNFLDKKVISDIREHSDFSNCEFKECTASNHLKEIFPKDLKGITWFTH